jgi:hypothetical protein
MHPQIDIGLEPVEIEAVGRGGNNWDFDATYDEDLIGYKVTAKFVHATLKMVLLEISSDGLTPRILITSIPATLISPLSTRVYFVLSPTETAQMLSGAKFEILFESPSGVRHTHFSGETKWVKGFI